MMNDETERRQRALMHSVSDSKNSAHSPRWRAADNIASVMAKSRRRILIRICLAILLVGAAVYFYFVGLRYSPRPIH
jgi:type VI protein secretion system component VasF